MRKVTAGGTADVDRDIATASRPEAGAALPATAPRSRAASIVHNRSHRWCSTPFQLAPWQALLAAAILLTVPTLLEGPPNVAWNTTSVAMLLFAGISGTVLAYSLLP
jgi:drug/metabolite transporter (DMT)-like permease